MKWSRIALAALLGIPMSASLLILGCELGSADSVSRGVTGGDNSTVNVSGFYTGGADTNSGSGYIQITSTNSGPPLTTLDLRQYGDQLEAVDNFGRVWKGTIGDAGSGTATFTLQYGDLTISGTIAISGTEGSYTGTMNGTWIEPALYATIHATATIPGYQQGGGGKTNTTVSVSANPSSLTANNQTSTLTASGGTGSYTWSVGSTNGVLSGSTGSSVTYTRKGKGDTTVTATDSEGAAGSATITQP